MGLVLAAFVSASVVAPTLPYTPANSGVDQSRPLITSPQRSQSDSSPTESWEQKLLRRYERKAS
jgi:hypothetical protein